jgi:hypothetical protein
MLSYIHLSPAAAVPLAASGLLHPSRTIFTMCGT